MYLRLQKQPTEGVWFIYLRKSRPSTSLHVDESGQIKEVTLSVEETLQRHRESLFKLAESLNIPVAEVFEEVGSGETIADRPEINRMLDYITRDDYNGQPVLGVLVMNVTRLARGETRDQGDILEIFKYSETLIVTPRKMYDPNDPADYKYLEFEFFMSHQEWQMIRERMEDGVFSAVAEGQYLGARPPYGLAKVKMGKVKTLGPCDTTQVVYDMFKWGIEEDMSPYQIKDRLNARGIPTYTGKDKWKLNTVTAIMSNPVYIGKIRWQYRKVIRKIDPKTRRKVKQRKINQEPLLFEGLHEGIVPVEWFEAYQRKFPKGAPVQKAHTVKNKLAGIIRCRKCRKMLKRETTKRDYGAGSYTRLKHADGSFCKCKSARIEVVMDMVVQSLERDAENFEIMVSEGSNQREVEEHRAHIEAKEKEIANVARAKETLWDRFDGLSGEPIPASAFNERMATLTKREKDLKDELRVLVANAPKEVDYAGKAVSTRAAIAALRDEEADPAAVNEFLRSVIDYIDYWNEGGWGEHNIEIDVHLR